MKEIFLRFQVFPESIYFKYYKIMLHYNAVHKKINKKRWGRDNDRVKKLKSLSNQWLSFFSSEIALDSPNNFVLVIQFVSVTKKSVRHKCRNEKPNFNLTQNLPRAPFTAFIQRYSHAIDSPSFSYASGLFFFSFVYGVLRDSFLRFSPRIICNSILSLILVDRGRLLSFVIVANCVCNINYFRDTKCKLFLQFHFYRVPCNWWKTY